MAAPSADLVQTKTIDTAIGKLRLSASAEALISIEFIAEDGRADNDVSDILELAENELTAYFEGELKAFTVPVSPQGTDFQQTVWQALMDVPYGGKRTYKAQAELLGDLKAIRAVALANGSNPIPIIIPCHRIVGSDGSLTGYAGGLERKRWLLAHEARHSGQSYQAELAF